MVDMRKKQTSRRMPKKQGRRPQNGTQKPPAKPPRINRAAALAELFELLAARNFIGKNIRAVIAGMERLVSPQNIAARKKMWKEADALTLRYKVQLQILRKLQAASPKEYSKLMKNMCQAYILKAKRETTSVKEFTVQSELYLALGESLAGMKEDELDRQNTLRHAINFGVQLGVAQKGIKIAQSLLQLSQQRMIYLASRSR